MCFFRTLPLPYSPPPPSSFPPRHHPHGLSSPSPFFQEEAEAAALQRITDALLAGKPARSVPLTADEAPLVAQLCLLTAKPLVYAANVAEDDLADPSANPHVTAVRELAERENAEIVVVSAQVGGGEGLGRKDWAGRILRFGCLW